MVILVLSLVVDGNISSQVSCGWEPAVMHVKYVVVKFANDNAVAGCSVLT